MRTGEGNRYQNSMTVSNIALASVVSNPFGKTAQSVMNEVLSAEIQSHMNKLDKHIETIEVEIIKCAFRYFDFLYIVEIDGI